MQASLSFELFNRAQLQMVLRVRPVPYLLWQEVVAASVVLFVLAATFYVAIGRWN